MTDTQEYYFVLVYSVITFIKKRKYENAFIKPAFIFAFLYIFLGSFKFEVISKIIKGVISKFL